jgi:hypothetical protein
MLVHAVAVSLREVGAQNRQYFRLRRPEVSFSSTTTPSPPTLLAGLFLPEVIPGILFGVTNAENLKLECFSVV